MAKRLRDTCHMRESEPRWKAHQTDAFVVRDLPWTIEKLKQLPPFEFENWAVIALGGIPNKVQVGDMGVDGRIYPVGTKPRDADTGGLFSEDWFPIQVKQTDKVGRPDIDPSKPSWRAKAKVAGSAASSWHSVIQPTPSENAPHSTNEPAESSSSSPSKKSLLKSMYRRCDRR